MRQWQARSRPPGGGQEQRRRARWRWALPLGGGLLFGVLGATGLLFRSPDAPPVSAGNEAAVDFKLPNLRPGETPVSLARYRGQPIVMNFWASWCTSCRREMRAFQAVHQQVGSRVVFLGVNHRDQRGPALELMEETGMTFPSGYDPEGRVGAAYGLLGLPTTVFVSPEGAVERRNGEMTGLDLEAAIGRLFPA